MYSPVHVRLTDRVAACVPCLTAPLTGRMAYYCTDTIERRQSGSKTLPPPVHRGECLVQTGHNRCVVSVFDYRVAEGETVRWQEEEVDWGSYLSWKEVQ